MNRVQPWHAQEANAVLRELDTKEKGLTTKEAERRLQQYELNEIKTEKKISPLKILLSQLKDPLIVILIAASAISALLGEMLDSTVIFAIVVASAVLGFTQEYRAEKASEALKKMVAPTTTVVREGKEQQIEAKYLVPGDVLKISARAR